MNVLWITNILFPEAEQLLTGSGELKASGGWMIGAANALLFNPEIQLIVATVSAKVKKLIKLEGDRITYYVLPMGRGNQCVNSEYEPLWKQVKSEVCPDVVHIHGTEYSQGYSYMRACGCDNVVISIQGLTSICSYYYCYGISRKEIYKNITIRDIMKGSVLSDQKRFKKRSIYEKEMLRMAYHVIGRTSWDKSHVQAINSEAKYHFCNEILRPEFYSGEKWSYGKCSKHSIFLSQAGYPLKGLHQLLKAMPLVLEQYPDAIVRIAGSDLTKTFTFKQRIRLSGYGKYIKSLIRKNDLKDKVFFTGSLDVEQMKREYLNANVFICPSSIENSPNSLGEAQILGTPCVASYVGGVMDMMKGDEQHLYRFEEIEMLSTKVCEVFAARERQVDMKESALRRHDKENNSRRLYDIYKEIVDGQCLLATSTTN